MFARGGTAALHLFLAGEGIGRNLLKLAKFTPRYDRKANQNMKYQKRVQVTKTKNRGCVFGAFWCGLGCQKVDFWSQNLQSINKLAPKIYTKYMKNRGCSADAFLERSQRRLLERLVTSTVPLLATILGKKLQKGNSSLSSPAVSNVALNSMPKKYRKLMPK